MSHAKKPLDLFRFIPVTGRLLSRDRLGNRAADFSYLQLARLHHEQLAGLLVADARLRAASAERNRKDLRFIGSPI